MKAKQLAQSYRDAPDDTAKDAVLETICQHYIDQIFELLKVRKPANDAGAIAILRELDGKWVTMSRLTNGAIVENGFSLLLAAAFPQLEQKWKRQG